MKSDWWQCKIISSQSQSKTQLKTAYHDSKGVAYATACILLLSTIGLLFLFIMSILLFISLRKKVSTPHDLNKKKNAFPASILLIIHGDFPSFFVFFARLKKKQFFSSKKRNKSHQRKARNRHPPSCVQRMSIYRQLRIAMSWRWAYPRKVWMWSLRIHSLPYFQNDPLGSFCHEINRFSRDHLWVSR